MTPRSLILPLIIAPAGSALHAQDNGDNEPLTINISAPLIETRWQDATTGVTIIEEQDIRDNGAPLQPTNALSLAPGILVQNRDNFAQNPRVSIRGFGARAPFGIRGVRVRLDGFPLTTVDGQAQVDAIDPSSIETIEVLRGANAVLHGNGSGGLLDYRSIDPRGAASAKVEAHTGEFGLRRLHTALARQHGQLAGRAALTQLEQAGYRQQSEVERRNAGMWLEHQKGDRNTFLILNHLHNPLAEDPGGLTYEEWQADPQQAAPLSKAMDAGQRVHQNILSLGMDQQLNAANERLHAQGWFLERDFRQQLPFPGDSLIDYERRIAGGAVQYQRPVGELTLHTQLSHEIQRDDRQRFCRNTSLDPFNCRSGTSGDLALDQTERARNTGLGLQLAGPIGANQHGRWLIGVRYDRLRLAIDDNLQAGGIDSSGERVYKETNYSAGYSHQLNPNWTAFGQYATSFQAPTFTEFANPAGSGFRPGLEPQQSRSFELGVRGGTYHYRLEANVFTVRVRDEIIVDDDASAPPGDERTFYTNADRTRRDGLELGGRWWPRLLPRLQLSGAFTYMDARFDDASENRMPGLPKFFAFVDAELDLEDGYFTGLSMQHIGARYADDANDVRVRSQTLTNLRLGRQWQYPRQTTRLVLGIENLFDSEYLGNLRINAPGERYYEPGAERHVYLGLEISWP